MASGSPSRVCMFDVWLAAAAVERTRVRVRAQCLLVSVLCLRAAVGQDLRSRALMASAARWRCFTSLPHGQRPGRYSTLDRVRFAGAAVGHVRRNTGSVGQLTRVHVFHRILFTRAWATLAQLAPRRTSSMTGARPPSSRPPSAPLPANVLSTAWHARVCPDAVRHAKSTFANFLLTLQ